MRSWAICAWSLLAVSGPRSILAQQPLQEIQGSDGSFAIGYAAPPPPPPPPPPPAPPAPPPPPPPPPAATTLVPVASPVGNVEIKIDAATPTPTPAPTPPPTPVQPLANYAHWTSICGVDGTHTSTGTAVTISVVNSHTVPLSMWLGGQTAIGDPSPTAIQQAASTSFVYPPCWAGNIGFDEEYFGNPDASLIEFSTLYQINIDVSYVSGYSVPITCYDENNIAFVGCNKDLWSLAKANGISCPGATSSNGHTCHNPANVPDGGHGPLAFFQPCAGLAYTWPNDNSADKGGGTPIVNCCVGAACPNGPKPTAVQQAVTYKVKARDLEPAAPLPDTSAHLHRHKHRHGLKRAHAHHFSS